MRQRVVGLVYDGLKRADVTTSPMVHAQIKKQASAIPLQNLQFIGEVIRLQDAFDKANIPTVFVKGITLAQIVYGSFDVRHSRDIDFLVAPEHVSAALDVLSYLQYRRMSPPEGCSERLFEYWLSMENEFQHVHMDKGVCVELHWQLLGKASPIHGTFPTATKTVVVADRHLIRTLGDDDLFIYLCAHGARHTWSRLKWLADIGGILDRKSDSEMLVLFRLAEAKGAGNCAAQAMLLCKRLFDTSVPDELIASFRSKYQLRLLERAAMALMAGAGEDVELEDQKFGSTRVALSQFLLGTGYRFWIAQLRMLLSTAHDVELVPLPRRFYFLYPVIRVPLWVFRRLKSFGKSPGISHSPLLKRL